MQKIAIVGSGYVGLTTGAILANSGYHVHMLDVDEKKIEVIRSGKSPFYETGLDKLIAHGLEQERLFPTTDYAEAIPGAEIVISCVGTPDNPDGSSNLDFVYAAARSIAKQATGPLIYVQKSTVPVGTGDSLRAVFAKEFAQKEIAYVSNPEFLRESSAIADTLGGDRVVVGGPDQQAVARVADLYASTNASRDEIAKTAGIAPPPDDYELQVVETSLKSAELVKVSANAFLALKISFANSIAKLADAADADVVEVMDGIGLDSRIGRAFLNAGRGYGGGCFPKDVSGLISAAYDHGVDLPIMVAATEVNESMPGYIVNQAKERYGTLARTPVAVLGLAFKAGTSDARRSPAVAIANALAHEAAQVKAYDPHANGEAAADLNRDVSLTKDQGEAAAGAKVLFIATDWPEFKELDWQALASGGTELVVDCMNVLPLADIEAAGLDYWGVGRAGRGE